MAGIPFTVSLFVAELALPARLVEPATVAIILAAAATGLLGFLLCGATGPPAGGGPAAITTAVEATR